MPATEPAGRIRPTVSELDRRLEEAYRAGAVEARQLDREWEKVEAHVSD
jgi:hypothetical protein